MNQIPDIILIDFCEWLKQQIETQHTVGSISFIFKEKYSTLLEHCAKLYLDSITSDETYDKADRNLATSITSSIDANSLVNNLIKVFSHGPSPKYNNSYDLNSESIGLSLMINVEADKDIEVDFLEWLIDNIQKPIDFEQISIREFKLLTKKYQTDCHKNDNDIQKLISSLRNTNRYILADKLINLLSKKSLKKAKDLGYVWGRYYNPNVRFKCLIIPLKKDIESYVDFIETRWDDLHYLTDNYLDIYYSKSDYVRSGFQTLNQLHYLSDELKKHAPAIILWKDRIVNAKSICISDLDNGELFKVIEQLVNDIRADMSLDEIVEDTNMFIKNLQKQKLPIFIDNHIEDNSMFKGATLTGNIVAGNNHGKLDYNIVNNQNDSVLIKEIENAKRIIQECTDINQEQIKALNEILDETLRAIKDNNQEKKDNSKKYFKKAINLIGVGDKLITALSNLVNLLNFFDYFKG